MSYCLERKVSLEQIIHHSVGYFGNNPFSMYYDRVMFPIHDVYGNLLSFQGRALFDFKAEGKPKYFHGAYDKSRHLYGLYDALRTLELMPFVVLVEGPFDVLALLRAGIPAVSGFGTAFSRHQALLLRRFFKYVGMWYDPDAAGLKGAENAELVCDAAGLRTFQLGFSGIKDCADYVVARTHKELNEYVKDVALKEIGPIRSL